MKAAHSQVPVFALYGERGATTDGEFLHIEEIVTRSEIYNWEIEPHTHRGLFQLLFVFAGAVEVSLDGVEHELASPAVVSVPAGVVHGFRFPPGTQGFVLTLAETRLFALPEQRAFLEPLLENAVSLTPDAATTARLQRLLGEIIAEFNAILPGRGLSLGGLVAAVLTLVVRLHLNAVHASSPASSQIALVHRLQSLIEQHYADHLPISFYAKALSVTESRLNRAVRAIAGKSPLELIQNRLLLEARRKLTYIAAPVATLAYELGFEDPAYFWRFFKRHMGVTPTEYREGGKTFPPQ